MRWWKAWDGSWHGSWWGLSTCSFLAWNSSCHLSRTCSLFSFSFWPKSYLFRKVFFDHTYLNSPASLPTLSSILLSLSVCNDTQHYSLFLFYLLHWFPNLHKIRNSFIIILSSGPRGMPTIGNAQQKIC